MAVAQAKIGDISSALPLEDAPLALVEPPVTLGQQGHRAGHDDGDEAEWAGQEELSSHDPVTEVDHCCRG
jgi:hypothetical protein